MRRLHFIGFVGLYFCLSLSVNKNSTISVLFYSFLLIGCSTNQQETYEIKKESVKTTDSIHLNKLANYSTKFPHSKHTAYDCNHCHDTKTEESIRSLPEINICYTCHQNLPNDTLSISKKDAFHYFSNFLTHNKSSDTLIQNLEIKSDSCYFITHPEASAEELNKQNCVKCHK